MQLRTTLVALGLAVCHLYAAHADDGTHWTSLYDGRTLGFRFRHHFVDRDLPGSQWGQTALVDVDRDGDLDFITGQTKGDIRWYEFQQDDKSWTLHLLGRDSPSDVGGLATDVDRDGRVDFVTGGAWYWQPPDPKTETWRRHVFDQAETKVHDIVAADVDGDGRDEIVTLSDKSNLRLYRIPTDDETRPWKVEEIWKGVHAGLAAGDIDGDGDIDLVRSQIWLENVDRGKSWREHKFCGIPWANRKEHYFYYLASRSWITDINHDGRPDIVLTENEIPDGRVAWFEAPENPTKPNWKPHILPASDDEARGPYHSLQLADFDNDGDLDIFAGEMEHLANAPHRWFIWENANGDGSQFIERVILNKQLGTHETQAGDVDGDGDIDLVGKLWRAVPDNGNRGRNHVDFLENLLTSTTSGDEERADAFRGLREFNPPAAAPADSVVAIVGATLIDGRGGPPVRDSVVVVRGNRVADVDTAESVKVPDNAAIVDASGLTLLPGLVDSHFHIGSSAKMYDRPSQFLQSGITTARDPGRPIEVYLPIRKSEKPMPRLFLTGPHFDQAPPAYPHNAVILGSPQAAREAVHRYVDQGASAIKVYFRLPLESIEATCDAAQHRGIPVTAHLELVDVDKAILAGLNGIEHITSCGTVLAEKDAAGQFRAAVRDDNNARRDGRYRLWAGLDLNSDRAQRLVKLIVEHNVFVSPTLAIFERRPRDKKQSQDFHVRGFEKMVRFVGMCHEAGAVVVTGSHGSVPFAKSGFAYQREMELLVESGLTPLEAITASTLKNARFLGCADRLGSIEPGKIADVVLVNGKPHEDIKAMYDVRRVMLNGRWVRRPAVSNAK